MFCSYLSQFLTILAKNWTVGKGAGIRTLTCTGRTRTRDPRGRAQPLLIPIRECHGFVSPCGQKSRAHTGTGTGWGSVTLTQPAPVMRARRVLYMNAKNQMFMFTPSVTGFSFSLAISIFGLWPLSYHHIEHLFNDMERIFKQLGKSETISDHHRSFWFKSWTNNFDINNHNKLQMPALNLFKLLSLM